MEMRGRVEASKLREYLMAGDATVTAHNTVTGGRFTFRVTAPRNVAGTALDLLAKVRFVKVLTGPDNTSDYSYLGFIGSAGYAHGRKSKMTPDSPSALAFSWLWKVAEAGQGPAHVEFWHEGRCGRCGRKLTVPESVDSGFGPECRGRLAA